MMRLRSPRSGVAGTAMSTPHFLLLFTAMLVAAAGAAIGHAGHWA
jgi:hypothetical protein